MDEVWKLYMRITLLTISLNRNHDDVEWMTLHYWIKDINALSVLGPLYYITNSIGADFYYVICRLGFL